MEVSEAGSGCAGSTSGGKGPVSSQLGLKPVDSIKPFDLPFLPLSEEEDAGGFFALSSDESALLIIHLDCSAS